MGKVNNPTKRAVKSQEKGHITKPVKSLTNKKINKCHARRKSRLRITSQGLAQINGQKTKCKNKNKENQRNKKKNQSSSSAYRAKHRRRRKLEAMSLTRVHSNDPKMIHSNKGTLDKSQIWCKDHWKK